MYDLKNRIILVTDAVGFIRSGLIKGLYNKFQDIRIIGVDNMNDYYDVRLKNID